MTTALAKLLSDRRDVIVMLAMQRARLEAQLAGAPPESVTGFLERLFALDALTTRLAADLIAIEQAFDA